MKNYLRIVFTVMLVICWTGAACAVSVSGTLPDGTRGEEYFAILTASGGDAPYTWYFTGLPGGLDYTFYSATSDRNVIVITGTPKVSGTFTVKLTCEDAFAEKTSETYYITIADKPSLSANFSKGKVGTKYTATAKATGGTPPYTWSKSGASWLNLDSTTGSTVTLSGTPTDETSTIRLTVTDKNNKSDSATFTIKATPKLLPELDDKTGNIGKKLQIEIPVGGSNGDNNTMTCSGLPEGLDYYPLDLEIRGTPRQFGTFQVKVHIYQVQNDYAEDYAVEDDGEFTLTVYDEDGNMPSSKVYGSAEAHGDSVSDPWEVDSVTTLIRLQKDVNEGRLNYAQYFKLTNDLDISAYHDWMPIGGKLLESNGVDNEDPINQRPFTGYFDGNGYTIKLNINKTESDRYQVHQGLFGTIYRGGIKNLTVTGMLNVTNTSGAALYIGGIAANLVNGYIDNCKFDGNITAIIQNDGDRVYAGGIVGRAGWSYYSYSIMNCKVGSVSDTSVNSYGGSGTTLFAGGIVGGVFDNNSSIVISGNYCKATLNGVSNLTGASCSGILGGYADLAPKRATISNNTVVDPASGNNDPEPDPDPSTASVTITKTSLASGTVNTAYSDTLTAQLSGGSYAITWSATGLPSWLTLNSSTGALTGTPTAAGNYTFTVTAYAGQLYDSKQFTIIVSAGNGTEMPEAEDEPPEFKSHGPVLEGQILIYFYVYMPTLYEDSYVTFKVLNDTTYNPPQEFDPKITTAGKLGTYYGFKCCLTSIQMYDPITATIHYNGGETVTHTWAFSEYLDKYYTSSSSSAPLKKLIGAMKDYGYYAQIALDEIHSWTLGVDHVAAECANVYTDADIEEAQSFVANYAKSWNVGTSGIKSIGYTLALDSDTTLELYLRPADDYTGNVAAYSRGAIGITDTNANLAVRQSDGRYLVQISGIPAHRLDYMNTIKVVTDKGEFDIKVSALSYVNTVLTSSKYNDNMKKAVTSLYRYYKATKEYRASTGQ